jgi:hypothetical protein
MPIDYKKYPPTWKTEIRPRILQRANNCCEVCGVENYSKVKRREGSVFEYEVKIVLTISHLDHDETNWDVKDERLKAMCQQCHLRYDAKEKYRRVMEYTNKVLAERTKNQQKLF